MCAGSLKVKVVAYGLPQMKMSFFKKKISTRELRESLFLTDREQQWKDEG